MASQAEIVERARMAGERIHHFHGGLRLRHNKKISCETPLERMPLPERLYVPLLQHAGSDSVTALVEAGQTVLKGEPIGAYEIPDRGFVHAPTSGTVVALEEGPIAHPGGQPGLRVVIEPDGHDQWCNLTPCHDWRTAEPGALVEAMRQAGVVGLGGAVFPTSTKLHGAAASGAHTIILNGAECEPYISCDEMLMREQAGKIITGTRILRRAIGAERAIIAIEDQMGAVEQVLKKALAASDAEDAAEVKVVRVTTIYPEGGERQLIQVLTGLEVPSGGLPSDLGLLVQNVGTAAAAADAVVEGKPLIERVVTISGNGVARPRNLLALFGTPIAALIEQCGGYEGDVQRLVLGGPMMGYALPTDAAPVNKASNCILALTADDIRAPQPEMPCIRCGECARVCPAVLLPQTLHWQASNGQWDDAREQGLMDCIECGCCDFVCPSHIPLLDWFRHGKGMLRQRAAEQAAADLARQRFEARETRLARIKQERKDRIAARKRQMAEGSESKKKVAEALERARKAREARDDGNDPS